MSCNVRLLAEVNREGRPPVPWHLIATVSHGTGKYSEIVWLPLGSDASTSTNAGVLTGLPNTYRDGGRSSGFKAYL